LRSNSLSKIILPIMDKNYVIAWKSLANGRIGRGKNVFEEEEARRMAAELNRDHPGYEHVAIPEDEENLIAAFNPKPSPDKILSLHALPETHHIHSMKKKSEEPSMPQEDIMSLEAEDTANAFLDDEMTGT